jgi:hypothetical protein
MSKSTISRKKLRANRRNGKLGGRPRNPEIAKIMAERGCTRAMASMVVRGLRK